MHRIILSGMPGKMITTVAERMTQVTAHPYNLNVHFIALAGPDMPQRYKVLKQEFRLLSPQEHEAELRYCMANWAPAPTVVDFSTPDVINKNAELYCKCKIPFVMGTTGGDRKALERVVIDSGNIAVISPNMAREVAEFEINLIDVVRRFPGEYKGYKLEIVESHQESKKDKSGTALNFLKYFQALGVEATPENIISIRDKETQRKMGIPEEFLDSHAWHTYSLTSPDGKVNVTRRHNINGRVPYADGTIEAISFLILKYAAGKKGIVYNMLDVYRK